MDFFRSGVMGVCLVLGAFGSFSATADESTVDPMAAIRAALSARDHAIAEISEENMRGASQRALNTVVAEGIRALRQNGDLRLARRYEQDWNNRFSNYLTGFMFQELGDHKPLSQWLANFYEKLEERLGRTAVRSGLLGDIYLMNFAIPVVFAPKGDWRTDDVPNRDWVEYRKHFIPFSNVITYWGSYIACTQIMKKQGAGQQGKKLCKQVSEKLRFTMGRYIAPKISDFVFHRANGTRTRLEITEQDLVYLTAEDIVRDLSQEGGAL